MRETSVRRAEEQLKTSIAKLQAGSATRSDSLRSRVTLGSAQLDLIRAQTDLATAEAGLARLIGETGRVKALDDSAFYRVIEMPDTAALRAEAEAKSPRIQSARRGGRRRARRAQGVPRRLLAQPGPLGEHGMAREPRERLRCVQQPAAQPRPPAGASSTGSQRELAMAERAASLDVADATAADERRAVSAELTARLAELEAARTQIDITQTSVVAAEEDLRVQQERYRLGASTIVDVLTSQEALNQAEVDVVVARFDYLRAKASLEALIGRNL